MNANEIAVVVIDILFIVAIGWFVIGAYVKKDDE